MYSRNPKCNVCGINDLCQSFKNNLQLKIPIKLNNKKNKPIKYTRAYVLINEKNEILVRNRPEKGMLASMLEVPNDQWVKNKKLLTTDYIVKNLKTQLRPRGFFEYSFSHFDLKTEIFFGNIKKSELSNANWIKKSTYAKSGLPTVIKRLLKLQCSLFKIFFSIKVLYPSAYFLRDYFANKEYDDDKKLFQDEALNAHYHFY